ncbi:Ig-like domain-containing protein [Cellulomonas composti]|uniref:Bacterial Ig-like domain-containing protein n=1 Tax=Cellulomonas composti TaxID=266130 RepID=A0A511JCW2_9CELL|nr:Ig-like domain-containing protein [Cellulomonas composti]GEL95619.1 hypothetical protein CCO02nite_22770 [Cellulomonas composti]
MLATALTAMPASAMPSMTSPLAAYDGEFAGSVADATVTDKGRVLRYDTDLTIDLADLGARQSATFTTTITADENASDWTAQGNLFGVGFLRVIDGETVNRTTSIGGQHQGDPIIWAQDNSGHGVGMCANSQFYSTTGDWVFGAGAGYQCGLPFDNADQSATAQGSSFRYQTKVRADGTWTAKLTPLDADGDAVTSFESGATPNLSWTGSLPSGTESVVPFIRTGLGDPAGDWEYSISDSSLKIAGDAITPTSAVLDLDGYGTGWPKAAGTAAASGWFFGDHSIDSGLSADGAAVRMSNAATSGTMQQLVTPSLEQAAGEPSTGAAYDEFDASFTVDSATGAYQDGLLVQVSPDNGSAARSGGVITLWHHDGQLQIGGIFSQPGVDDVAGADDLPWWFNRTFAKVSADEPHTIGLTQRYLEGKPDTLVVSVDGEQVGAVGTWEAYHDQFGGGKQVSRGLLFRAASSVPDADGRLWSAQPAVPANAGNGYLFSDIAYSVSDGDAIVTPEDATIRTTSDTIGDWEFKDRALGHHGLLTEGLHIWTDASVPVGGSPEPHKSAGYYGVDWSLADVAAAPEPSQDTTVTSGAYKPGLQLNVDLDGDGDFDGYLVGEDYRDYWWLSEASADFLANPLSAGMDKGADAGQTHVRYRGSLIEWASQFPAAQVDQVGYSFGSGAIGDMVLHSMTYNHTTFEFAVTEPAVCEALTPAGPVVTATNTQGWNFAAETRAKGHNEFVDGGLHVWTEDSSSLAKAAGYLAVTPVPLASVGSSFALNLADGGTGTAPSLQLGVDRDGDGDWDGYLVNEPRAYAADHFWINKSGWGVPAGMGYPSYGTLGEFVSHNPDAKLIAIGYSLGSGVQGDYTIESISVGCQTTTFSAATQPDTYPTTTDELSTNLAPNGWTAGATDGSTAYGQWVDGGYTFGVPGGEDWPTSWLERDYTGDLASLGTVDFETSRPQYFGVHVHTAKGWLTYEKEATYAGKWWSTSDFGVGSGLGYASFATLADYITNNPGLAVDKVRVIYTAGDARKTTLASVTFGGVRYAFDYVSPQVPIQAYLDADDVATFAGKATNLTVKVFPFTATGTVTVKDGDTVVGSAETVLGVASVALATDLTVGDHTLSVSFAGTGYAADDISVHAVVAKNEAQVSVAWPPTLSRGVVADVTVTVGAVESGATVPSGQVQLFERGGVTPIATGTLNAGGVAHVQIPSNLAIGYHNLTVKYLGDAATEPADAVEKRIKVTKAVTTLTATTPTNVYGVGGTLTVHLAAGDVPLTGKVSLEGVGFGLKRVRPVGAGGNAVFSLSPTLKAGTHSVIIRYAGTSLARGVTQTVTFTVVKATSTTTAVLKKSTVDTAHSGALVVKVTAPGVTVKGKVKVTVVPLAGGSTVTRWADLSNGRVTVQTGTLDSGQYRVRAFYLGSDNVATSFSAPTVLTVS